jgi:hypothetical protein
VRPSPRSELKYNRPFTCCNVWNFLKNIHLFKLVEDKDAETAENSRKQHKKESPIAEVIQQMYANLLF